jgi:hypothetical protein
MAVVDFPMLRYQAFTGLVASLFVALMADWIARVLSHRRGK